MSNPLQQTIEALAKEKGIEPDVVISAIEEAVATASRKYYKTGENLKTRFNMETGQVDLFALKQVVQDVANAAAEISIDEARQMYRELYGDEVADGIELGDEMEFPKPTEVLGRIAAQTAKQVIFQKVREAERENIFTEYNQQIGEVENAHGQAVRERRHHRGGRAHRGRASRARNSRAPRATTRATASAPSSRA